MENLTRGKLAKEANVNIQTIRYYERQKLIPALPRNDSGYCAYTPDIVERVKFIRHAQEMGFSLKEISQFLSLKVIANESCEKVQVYAKDKMKDIEEKIKLLQKIHLSLSKLLEKCDTKMPTGECPILEAFSHDIIF